MAENEVAPLAYTIQDAIKVSGMTRSRLYVALKEGQIEAKKAGRRTIIPAESLRAFIYSLPRA